MSTLVHIHQMWIRFTREEKGVTTVEYAIMLALVAVAVALATPGISDAVTSVFDEATTAMTSAGS